MLMEKNTWNKNLVNKYEDILEQLHAESRLIESKQIYQNLLRQTDRNIYSFIRENSKLRQEIKSLKQTIKKLTKEKEKYEKLTCSVNVA